MLKIVVARDFSRYPGGRLMEDGPFSGEAFYLKILAPALWYYSDVFIDFDGGGGYPVGWLSEAFRHVSREQASRITFKSDEEPSLINEIYEILEEGE